MKILFIHNTYQQQGGEDSVVEMESSLLRQNGHEVKIEIFDNASIAGKHGRLKNSLRAIYNSQSALKVKTIIKSFRPDVIHVHNLFFVASPSVLFVAHKFKVPVVLTVHNYRLICANALLLRNNRICELCVQKTFPLSGIKYKCYRNSAIESALVTSITGIHKILNTWQHKVTTYIVLNAFSKSRFINSSLKLIENKITIKSNFITDSGMGAAVRENYFLFAGRVSKEKGVDILLEAFAEMPEHKIIIAGDGPEKEILEKKYETFSNIHFTGKCAKLVLLEKMKNCKALVFPSIWYEGMPMTIIEAFSTGTPVIASRLGAMEELIEDGYNGFLFNPGDADDLKRKIQLFNNSPGVQVVYENARKTYLAKYTPETNYAAIIDIYKNAILQKSKMPL